MDFKGFIEKVESSDGFKTTMEKHDKDSFYLANVFCIRSSDAGEMQAGYFDSKMDRMTSFSFEDDELKIDEEKEVFKRPDTKVLKLDLAKVKVRYKEMQKIIKAHLEEKYTQEKASKEIFILQDLEIDEKPVTVWNITYITAGFNVINIRMDAGSGEIISSDIKSILQFRTNLPGHD